MRILVGCETSGKVREAFRKRGHDAWSCDIDPADDGSPFHFQCDVLDIVSDGWDLGIFHPPCTRLAKSGVRWLHERDLWDEMRAACEFFLACLNAPINRVAVENPEMHGHAMKIIGRGPDFTIQPWQFGHPETKETWFWTRGLPPLRATNVVRPVRARIHNMPDTADRAKLRSETYDGIADAIARQWDCPAGRMARWNFYLKHGYGWP